ncbi:MAG TPA: hypothetical protein VEY92_14115 [Pseudoxanthomonas sp.]|nr:hypothetical protein [Pseudoxanthomonas sp.]
MVIPSSTVCRLSSNNGTGGPARAGGIFAADPIAENGVELTLLHGLGQTRRGWHRAAQALAGGDNDAFTATVLACLTALPPVVAESLPAAVGLSAVIESVSGARP